MTSMDRMRSSSSSRRRRSTRSRGRVARVLRYPDGRVRRIYYPQEKMTKVIQRQQHLERKQLQEVEKKEEEEEEEERSSSYVTRRGERKVPDTAAELLAMVRSPEARRERIEEEKKAREDFEVCETMPTRLENQKVAVLADADAGDVLCLDVLRRDQRSNVLPSSRLEDIIQRTEVCQGLLVFASERDAEAYASSSSSSKNLVACEADAFDIFMLASAARAVCVVIREGADPEPLLLKQLLRGRDASPEEQLGF